MTQRTASETRALRRSSRLASSHASEESCKPAVQLRTRRTTGQLRLPSSSTPTPKRGAKKRSTVASRRFKSKSRRRGSSSARDSTQSDEIPKLSSRDICREIPLYEPVGAATKDCIYCYPNSAYNRCCHNRGQPVPESPGSVLGQNVILPSVETDDKPVRLFRGGHPISLEEERNVQEVIDMLAKKREQDQLWRAASNPPASEHSISVPSVNQHGDVMVKPEPATTSSVCMGPPIHQSVQQVGSRQNCLPLQGSHVRFADASSDSYVSDGTVGTSGKDTEKWKKKLLLCEPLRIPLYRPPTPYPDADMVSPASNSPHSPKPVSVSDLSNHSYFANNTCSVSTGSQASTSSQQQHPTPTSLGTTQAYQPKEWPSSFGTNTTCSLTCPGPSIPLRASDTGNLFQNSHMGLQANRSSKVNNKVQNKPSDAPEMYMQPPTPVLRARQLPDYAMYPPHSAFM